MEGSVLRHLRLSIFLIITSFAITSCGGSDSAPPATGKVAVMITDGPTEDFEQILITLDRMLLLGGDGGHQVLYEGEPITFDLLDMRDRADFAFASEVLADDYSKIRLEVSEIQLVDTNGTESQPVTLVHLPANGKIDLNPQGPFSVLPGQTTIVELDMDANRSFQVVLTGNGGYRLRPVIFVNVYPGDFSLRSKFVRVFGTVDSVTAPGPDQHALVCSLSFVPQLGVPVTGDPEDCVRIFANEFTKIFDQNGLAINFANIAPPNEPPAQLTGIGYVSRDGADVLFDLDAFVMEIGPRASATDPVWETLRGLVVSAQTDCNNVPDPLVFCFQPFDSTTPIKTLLQADTRVFDSSGAGLDKTYIDDNDSATVDGLRVNNGTEELRAALVVLNPVFGEDFVSGDLTGFNPGEPYDVLTIENTATTDIWHVCFNEETDVLRILVDDEVVTIVDLLDPSVLDPSASPPLQVEATGTPSDVGVTGCHLIADVVIIE